MHVYIIPNLKGLFDVKYKLEDYAYLLNDIIPIKSIHRLRIKECWQMIKASLNSLSLITYYYIRRYISII